MFDIALCGSVNFSESGVDVVSLGEINPGTLTTVTAPRYPIARSLSCPIPCFLCFIWRTWSCSRAWTFRSGFPIVSSRLETSRALRYFPACRVIFAARSSYACHFLCIPTWIGPNEDRWIGSHPLASASFRFLTLLALAEVFGHNDLPVALDAPSGFVLAAVPQRHGGSRGWLPWVKLASNFKKVVCLTTAYRSLRLECVTRAKNTAGKFDRSWRCNQGLRFSRPLIVCPSRLELTLPCLVANNPKKRKRQIAANVRCGKLLQKCTWWFQSQRAVLGLAGCHHGYYTRQ